MPRSKFTAISGLVLALAAGWVEPISARGQDDRFGWDTASTHAGLMDGVSSGVCDGVVMFDNHAPVAVFGLNKRPNDKGRYTYLFLLKDRPRKRAGIHFKMEGSWYSSERETNGTTRLTLSGKQIEFGYHFKAEEKTLALLEETIKVGGKDLKKGDPRVYLIDLTGDEVVYRPVAVDLPDEVPDFDDQEKRRTWGPRVLRAIERLKERSPEVRQFFAPRLDE
jgi:hypothetical protein